MESEEIAVLAIMGGIVGIVIFLSLMFFLLEKISGSSGYHRRDGGNSETTRSHEAPLQGEKTLAHTPLQIPTLCPNTGKAHDWRQEFTTSFNARGNVVGSEPTDFYFCTNCLTKIPESRIGEYQQEKSSSRSDSSLICPRTDEPHQWERQFRVSFTTMGDIKGSEPTGLYFCIHCLTTRGPYNL